MKRRNLIVLICLIFVFIALLYSQVDYYSATNLRAVSRFLVGSNDVTGFLGTHVSNDQLTTNGYQDSSITLPKLSRALLNYIGAGGSVNNNPDDVTLENIGATSLAFNRSRYYIDADNYASLEAAVDTAVANNWGVTVTSMQTIGADVTIPDSIVIKFTKNGSILAPLGRTFTVNGHIDAGRYEIFEESGAGTITLTNAQNNWVYPEWWGASPADSEDDTDEINAALASGKNVLLSDGEYYVTTLAMTQRGQRLSGAGGMNRNANGGVTVIKPSAATDSLLSLTGGSALDKEVSNIFFLGLDGGNYAKYGIYVGDGQSGMRIKDCYFEDFRMARDAQGDTSAAIMINSCFNNKLERNKFYKIDIAIKLINGTQVTQMFENQIAVPYVYGLYIESGDAYLWSGGNFELSDPADANGEFDTMVRLHRVANIIIDSWYSELGNLGGDTTITWMKISNRSGEVTRLHARSGTFSGGSSYNVYGNHQPVAIDVSGVNGWAYINIEQCKFYEFSQYIINPINYRIHAKIQDCIFQGMQGVQYYVPYASGLGSYRIMIDTSDAGNDIWFDQSFRVGDPVVFEGKSTYNNSPRARLTLAESDTGKYFDEYANNYSLYMDGGDTLWMSSSDKDSFEIGYGCKTIIMKFKPKHNYSAAYPHSFWSEWGVGVVRLNWQMYGYGGALSTAPQFRFFSSPEDRTWYLGGAYDDITDTPQIEDNRWNMLAVVRDTTQDSIFIYLNGEKSGGLFFPDSNLTSSYTAYIFRLLRGSVDDIAAYDTSLTAAQLDSIWNNGYTPDLETYPTSAAPFLAEWFNMENYHWNTSGTVDTVFGVNNSPLKLGYTDAESVPTWIADANSIMLRISDDKEDKVESLIIKNSGQISTSGGIKLDADTSQTSPVLMEIQLYPTTADSMRFIITNPTDATKDTSSWISLH